VLPFSIELPETPSKGIREEGEREKKKKKRTGGPAKNPRGLEPQRAKKALSRHYIGKYERAKIVIVELRRRRAVEKPFLRETDAIFW